MVEKKLKKAEDYFFGKDVKSNKGTGSKVPDEIQKKFNWGVFALPLFWSIANKYYFPLWILLFWWVPVVNLVFSIHCGQNGNKWAWQSREWISAIDFQMTQRAWARWGFVYMFCVMGLSIFLLLGITGTLKGIADDKNQELDNFYCKLAIDNVPKTLSNFAIREAGYIGAISSSAQLVQAFTKYGSMKKLSDTSVISKDGVIYDFIVRNTACDIARGNCGVALKREALTMCPNNISFCKEQRDFCKLYVGQTEAKEMKSTTRIVLLDKGKTKK